MDPLSLAVGGFLVVVGGAVGFRFGCVLIDRQALQHRLINRELGQELVGRRRQLEAARYAVGRLVTDPRTAPHDRLALEEHVAPLLIERGQVSASLAPAPNRWRRAISWLARQLIRRR